MPSALDLLELICKDCGGDFFAQFNDNPRPAEDVIAGDRVVTSCCYVRDSIRFLNSGRLIFAADKKHEGSYCRNYFVVCRKLTIVGGSKPADRTPCGTDDPGSTYAGNNVITWDGRLKSQPPGGTQNQADPGTDRSGDTGNPDGPAGGNGTPGAMGLSGGNGQSAPGSLTIVALEVEIVGLGSHLTIDWDGQTGGPGGPGQRGGDGGDGGRGADGETESSWGSESCTRRAGNGGRGGNGGTGGVGGSGGRGGNAGPIYIISTLDQISGSGVFVGGDISYVNDGGSGGEGGTGGQGGARGAGGEAGGRNSPCGAGERGDAGDAGVNTSTRGSPGVAGAPSVVEYKKIESHTCSDSIPLPLVVGSVSPHLLTRGFASPDTVDVAVSGQNLAQVVGVTSSLSGVAAVVQNSSSDSQLDLRFTLAGNSATGAGSLVFERGFGQPFTQAAAITVQRFEVLAVAPASSARGNTVSITITGQGFDPAALAPNVNVSGTGLTVLNVAVISGTQVQCLFEITATAQQTVRNVTVSMGGKNHTLTNGFSVTA